jgi:hypothetical protein
MFVYLLVVLEFEPGLTSTRQVLYHMGQILSSFGFSYFSGRVLRFLPRLTWTAIPLDWGHKSPE